MNFVKKIELTGKKIFTQDDFISFTKLLLTAPIFAVKNKDKDVIKETRVYNEWNVEFYSMPLNVKLDFDAVLFLVKSRFEQDSHSVRASLTDFYNFVNPEKTDVNNRNNAYKARIEGSLKRIKSINITLKSETKTIICSMLNDAYIDYETNELVIEFNRYFDNFFIVDKRAIYNINRKVLRKITSEYGKILYLYYLCHNANKEANTISVEDLKERFLFDSVDDKKFIMNIRDANEELKRLGVLLVNKEVKDGRKKTVAFKVLIDTKVKSEGMVLPQVKELKEVKEKDKFAEDFDKFMKLSGRA